MTRLACFPLALALAACGIRDRPELRYQGQITPTAPSSRCTPTNATASIRDGEITFAPDEGTWILQGKAEADTLSAHRSRPTPDHKSYDTAFKAQWTQAAIHGTYTTPFCTYRVDLTSN